jgi:hypothetical protein
MSDRIRFAVLVLAAIAAATGTWFGTWLWSVGS